MRIRSEQGSAEEIRDVLLGSGKLHGKRPLGGRKRRFVVRKSGRAAFELSVGKSENVVDVVEVILFGKIYNTVLRVVVVLDIVVVILSELRPVRIIFHSMNVVSLHQLRVPIRRIILLLRLLSVASHIRVFVLRVLVVDLVQRLCLLVSRYFLFGSAGGGDQGNTLDTLSHLLKELYRTHSLAVVSGTDHHQPVDFFADLDHYLVP